MSLPSTFPPLTTKDTAKRLTSQHPQGFTVVETMVVIAILGILFSIATVVLGNLAPKFDLDNGARMTAMALNEARVQAIARGHNMVVSFGSNTFTITDDVNNEVVAEGQLPLHLSLSAGDDSTFTPLGTVTAPLIVTVSNGDNSRDVSVGLIGEVQIQ
ncbi:MAG: prepilin-type N-terminal cleavage/methylation domain-containing protein [Deltaproteobacteria bacterium]|nr:prepilin-type N-terminal cleavage/methylation domain-containing protein [Deltaproteobacteria bacterium]